MKHGLFTNIMLLNKRYVENNLIGFIKEVGGFWKFGDKVQGDVGQYCGSKFTELNHPLC